MIEFDTVHIDSTDIKILGDTSIFEDENHKLTLRDQIKFEEKEKGYVFTLDTIHKLNNPNKDSAIEITIISMFLPYQFPPARKTIVDMIKAHHFHTDAILSEKSKNQQIEGHTDILLYPDNRTIEKRVQNFEAMIHQVIKNHQKGNET